MQVVAEPDVAAWDHFVQGFPAAGPLHSRPWMESFRSERLTPIYLRLMADGVAVGAMAGLVVDPKIPILRRIDRRLFLFTGPALGEMTAPAIRDCMLSLCRHAREQGFSSLVCLGRDYPHGYDWGESRVHIQILHEYIVDMSDPWDAIRGRMRRSIPEQARKAERHGVSFHEDTDPSRLARLMALVANTRSRRLTKSGTHFSPYYIPYLAEHSLHALCESGIARFFSARQGEEDLCILLVLSFARRAYALLVGSSDAGYRHNAPAFLWFNTLRTLKASGVEVFNLAGGGPQSGHGFFKESLGAERMACTGSVSPYLKGPIGNVLFQSCRSVDRLVMSLPLAKEWASS